MGGGHRRLESTIDTDIVPCGGRAKHPPYAESITVVTISGGVEGLVHSMAIEIDPMSVNGLHHGMIGDSPF